MVLIPAFDDGLLGRKRLVANLIDEHADLAHAMGSEKSDAAGTEQKPQEKLQAVLVSHEKITLTTVNCEAADTVHI